MRDTSTLLLPARVDSETSERVGETLLAAIRPGGRVIIDGSAVSYMSAAGVRVLATALHRAQEAGARLVLCSFNGAAEDCLMVSGFSRLFDVAASVEEAERRLGTGGPTAGERLHARGGAG